MALLNQWPAPVKGNKTFQTRPPLPSYISPWQQYNFLFRGCRMPVRCQNGSDNNYRMKLTSAWALVANSMLVANSTTEVIPPSRWVCNSSCKSGLGKNRQSLPSTTQRRYYNVSNLPAETLFKGQRTLLGNTAFHLPPTYRSAAQSKYWLHFPFPNGR